MAACVIQDVFMTFCKLDADCLVPKLHDQKKTQCFAFRLELCRCWSYYSFQCPISLCIMHAPAMHNRCELHGKMLAKG